MSTFKLTQTGTQMQADLDKVEGMANIKSVGSGLSLSGAGQLSASGGSLPTGGTAGQVLTKVDGTDYNTQWANAGGGGVSFGKVYLHQSSEYGDYSNFSIVYADGTSAGQSDWYQSEPGVMCIDTNGPFRIEYNIPQVVKGANILYGSNPSGIDGVPFFDLLTANVIIIHNKVVTGTYISVPMFTLIGKDLHITYVDTGLNS